MATASDDRDDVVELVGGDAPPVVVVIDGTERGRFRTRAAADDAFRRQRLGAARRP